MNALRVEAYLRSACSVLNFDVGELWCVRENPGQAPSFHFVQLYSSPAYEDFHNILVRPSKIPDGKDEEKHRFSPIICRGVCDGGQIVWSNTKVSEGLIGRYDLPLNTAVGMPICSVGVDLCIIVLFAVESIQMTSSAVEFLICIARAASGKDEGFLPASISTMVTPAKTEQFVGVWDMMELLATFSKDVDFHMLSLGQMQKYFDYQEKTCLTDSFVDFRQTRDGRFSSKQLAALYHVDLNQRNGMYSASNFLNCDSLIMTGDGSNYAPSSITDLICETARVNEDKPKGFIGKLITYETSTSLDILFTCGPGAFTIELDSVDIPSEVSRQHKMHPLVDIVSILNTSRTLLELGSIPVCSNLKDQTCPLETPQVSSVVRCSINPNKSTLPIPSSPSSSYSLSDMTHFPELSSQRAAKANNRKRIIDPIKSQSFPCGPIFPSYSDQAGESADGNLFPIDGRVAYRKNRERFHEFMVGIMGMSVFDAVELWLLSDRTNELYVVAALHRDSHMQLWTSQSRDLRLKCGQDVPGHCMKSLYPFWDHNYSGHDKTDPCYPRAEAAKRLGILTAFGVPIPGI